MHILGDPQAPILLRVHRLPVLMALFHLRKARNIPRPPSEYLHLNLGRSTPKPLRQVAQSTAQCRWSSLPGPVRAAEGSLACKRRRSTLVLGTLPDNSPAMSPRLRLSLVFLGKRRVDLAAQAPLLGHFQAQQLPKRA